MLQFGFTNSFLRTISCRGFGCRISRHIAGGGGAGGIFAKKKKNNVEGSGDGGGGGKRCAPPIPRGEKQQEYFGFLENIENAIVLGVGPAGTGKTMFACHRAIAEISAGLKQKIILTRPMIAVDDEELGFLPGDINAKMAPWVRPFMDIFLEYYSQTEIDRMIQERVIEISPLAYMRGRTFRDAFIIADEMQNSSPSQMLMLITRIGEGSRMVITGDLNQSDRAGTCGASGATLGGGGAASNGLADFLQRLNSHNQKKSAGGAGAGNGAEWCSHIQLVRFRNTDVERSPIVKLILRLYDFEVIVEPETNQQNKIIKQIVIEGSNDCAMIPKKEYKHLDF